MSNAASFDQISSAEPSHSAGPMTHAVTRSARPATSGSHEQLMHAAVVAAVCAAATAADLRRAIDASRRAQRVDEAVG